MSTWDQHHVLEDDLVIGRIRRLLLPHQGKSRPRFQDNTLAMLDEADASTIEWPIEHDK